jgi:hypothetical protein
VGRGKPCGYPKRRGWGSVITSCVAEPKVFYLDTSALVLTRSVFLSLTTLHDELADPTSQHIDGHGELLIAVNVHA